MNLFQASYRLVYRGGRLDGSYIGNNGRDRTGTLSAVLLGLLGVSESDVSKDYELTYFAPEYWSMLNGEYKHARTSYGFKSIFATLKATGETTLQKQIEKLLLNNGVSQKDIDDFRTIMLE